MKVTLDEIWSYGPCQGRWKHLLGRLDPLPADDEPFPVARVLDVNGVADTLWLLGRKGELRPLVRFACDCAERAVARYWAPYYPEDRRPQDAIDAARRCAENPTAENRRKALAAAQAVVDAAAEVVNDPRAANDGAHAAYYAARAAAEEDAGHAANHTAVAAAYYVDNCSAEDAAEECAWQIDRLRKILEGADRAVAESKIWRLLLGFVCDCAERAVERYWAPGYPSDRRPQRAIAAARRWLAEPTAENRAKADAAAESARAAEAAAHAHEDAKELRGERRGLTGDCTALHGNCTGLHGNCSGLEGNCTGLRGDCSDLSGDIREKLPPQGDTE